MTIEEMKEAIIADYLIMPVNAVVDWIRGRVRADLDQRTDEQIEFEYDSIIK